VQKQGEAHAHYGRVVSGRIAAGDEVTAEVDHEARWATMRHHSATHLLHRALRQVLGEATHQQGSYVAPDTCTFDFNLTRAVTDAELDAIFGIVNRAVRDDIERSTRVMAMEDARQTGAMMLFGEKYGDMVRVVSFGDFSHELCGGTHVDRSGQIGLVTPVRESSVGAGVRRIEFLAGEVAERRVRELNQAATEAARLLNTRPQELPERVSALLEDRRQLRRRVGELGRTGAATGGFKRPLRGVYYGVVYDLVDAGEPDVLRAAADGLLDRQPDAVAAIVFGGDRDHARVAMKVRSGAAISAGAAFAKARESGLVIGGGNDRLAQGSYDHTRLIETLSALLDASVGLRESELPDEWREILDEEAQREAADNRG
jgi:alanyl-tRNA synthetase